LSPVSSGLMGSFSGSVRIPRERGYMLVGRTACGGQR
jgi:hypothetical protein